jgi:hypothetical protein
MNRMRIVTGAHPLVFMEGTGPASLNVIRPGQAMHLLPDRARMRGRVHLAQLVDGHQGVHLCRGYRGVAE